MLRPVCALAIVILVCVSTPALAHPTAHGVGMGVAAGGIWSPTEIERGTARIDVGSGFAWGFFVDIPLLETFYISPAAMLYEIDFGAGRQPVTDIDLNFKFIVPIRRVRIGGGLLAGLSTGAPGDDYSGHYGLLGYFSFNLVSNLDAFLLAQYKRMQRSGTEIDQVHGYAGGMFRF